MSTPSSLDPIATNTRRRRNLTATTGDTNKLVARICVAVLGRDQQAVQGVELTIAEVEHPLVLFTMRLIAIHRVGQQVMIMYQQATNCQDTPRAGAPRLAIPAQDYHLLNSSGTVPIPKMERADAILG